ncbi:Microsomal signal peptidase 25 kDa subunit (SPC25)-domain containing protein [Rhodotorula toruloides]|uniref:Signal peptidase complex subunit 2 n=1 Tax=Rhodotorula toruloides TaxID=5286 RepID=A0A2S9ZXA5_RHOTO|nr:Microsomal signal peptidase 25 kDa subunit (SPC25)-domain containing protein [Rhodotorula toruloides]
MAKKSATKGKQPADTATVAAEPALGGAEDAPVVLPAREPAAKVNNASLTELKNALDDVVKEYFCLSTHRFTRSHAHEDVRLALGWTSVAVAAATGYYGYVTEFHESKYWVSVGVVLYVVLNTVLALYVAYVEKNIIFVGKRRTIASRISTERLTISSLAFSSPTSHTTSPSQAATYPLYSLTLEYTHSSNANKSLLASSSSTLARYFGEMVDSEGRVARGEVERWLGEAFGEVCEKGKGSVGGSASEGEGRKSR